MNTANLELPQPRDQSLPSVSAANDRTAVFVRLLRKSDRQLATYVHASLANWSDAEDVLQQVRVSLWERFDRFELGTDFNAWAFTTARYAILNHLANKSRDRLLFAPEVLEWLVVDMTSSPAICDIRLEILPHCISKLSEKQRYLLLLCYESDFTMKEVATLLGRSTNATYIAVSRARKSLRKCIERQLAKRLG